MTDPVDIAVSAGRLHGERWRAPGQTTLLLHSGVTDLRSWSAMADELDGSIDLLAYDRRGHGGSPVGEKPVNHLDDLLDLVDSTVSGQVVVVGNSMGGGLALDLALLRPERVSGLVLLAPSVSGAPELDDQLDSSSLVLGQRLAAAAADDDDELVTRLEAWLWLDGPGSAEGRVGGSVRRLFLDMAQRIRDHAGSAVEVDSGVEAWARLEQIGCPAVVACGELDVPVVQWASRQVAQRLPVGRFELLTDVAHVPALERPDIVAALVTALVTALADR